jgi:hypothetical protein
VSGVSGAIALVLYGIGAVRHASHYLTEMLPEPVWDGFWVYRYGVIFAAIIAISISIYARLRIGRAQNRALHHSRVETLRASLGAIQAYGPCIERVEYTHRLILTRGARPEEAMHSLKRSVNDCVDLLCTHTARSLTALTGNETNVCVKLLVGEEIVVRGRSRKGAGLIRSKSRSPNRFSAERNTAFRVCIDEGASYYINNDLVHDDTYENVNPDCLDLYDATIVATVDNVQRDVLDPIIWGFVCADNFGGGFDENECLVVLKTAGHLIYDLLNSYEATIQKQAQARAHQILKAPIADRSSADEPRGNTSPEVAENAN